MLFAASFMDFAARHLLIVLWLCLWSEILVSLMGGSLVSAWSVVLSEISLLSRLGVVHIVSGLEAVYMFQCSGSSVLFLCH